MICPLNGTHWPLESLVVLGRIGSLIDCLSGGKMEKFKVYKLLFLEQRKVRREIPFLESWNWL